MKNSERASEEVRHHAWNLATRIRFLREETREGRDTIDNTKELETKTHELGTLFDVDPNIVRIDFEVRDTMEVDDELQGLKSIVCLRTVQVNNPNRSPDAQDIEAISLLHKDQPRENLVPAISEILPPGYGGI